MEEERFKELRDKLSGRNTPGSRLVRDVGRTAGSLATGAVGFAPDLGAAISTTIPVTSFGEKGFDILPSSIEKYLRSIPNAPVSQALGLPATAQPGTGEKLVGDIFSKISGAAEKYIGEPAVEAGAASRESVKFPLAYIPQLRTGPRRFGAFLQPFSGRRT